MGEPEAFWPETSPFEALIGLRRIEAANGKAVTELSHRPDLANRKGDLHGGLLSSVLDLTASQAVRSAEPELRGLSTINLSVQFLATASGAIRCRAVTLRAGQTLAWAEAKIVRCDADEDVLIATASCAFRLIRVRERT